MAKEISVTNPVIFTIRPEPHHVTAHDIGCQIACDSSVNQRAMLIHWQQEVELYKASECGESWAMQCRFIAEDMSDDQCRDVGRMLETLVEHLRSLPIERAQKIAAAT